MSLTVAPSPTLVLIDAATVLAENGWTQGVMRDHNTGAFCAYAALDEASENYPFPTTGIEFDDAYSLVTEFLQQHYPADGVTPDGIWAGQLSTWNDDLAKSDEEVIAVFLAVAEENGGVAA